MLRFTNRHRELESLSRAFRRRQACLYILYGRRRLGKTTLLKEFASELPGVYHVADRSAERDAMRLLAGSIAFGLNEPTFETVEYNDWYALLGAYDRLRSKKRSVLILDEFQYLCEVQPAFSSILQRWWDEHWSKQNIMVVLCGSVMSMMYRETLSRSSPLFGRRTGQWLLKPLRFTDMAKFFRGMRAKGIVEMWALTGGVPRYGELASQKSGFFSALRDCVLTKDGPLYSEAKFLLQDEVTTANVYWSLLHTIGSGVSRISEIAGRLGLPANQLTRYLSALQDLGLVCRKVPVTEKQPQKSKRGLYEIADPFLRLWFGSVVPFESLIEFGKVREVERLIRTRLPAHMAWSFEQVCREFVEDRAHDYGAVRVGKYWDRSVEVDVVAVDEKGTVAMVGECKWTSRQVGLADLRQLKEKVSRLWPQKEKTIRLVLFSGGGFSKSLCDMAGSEGVQLVNCRDLVQGNANCSSQ